MMLSVNPTSAQVNPNSADDWYQLSEVFTLLGQTEQAVACYRHYADEALSTQLGEAEPPIWLASLLVAIGLHQSSLIPG
jgi:hypothetical protein